MDESLPLMAIAVTARPTVSTPLRSTSWDGVELGRILIAEDEPRISSFLERGLSANGFTTDVADSGDEALVLARSGRFDLVILDVGLPRMDGFEVLRELRGSNVRVPVVMLTARETVRDTVAGLDAGADDYLTKPFRFDELLARVRARLRDVRTHEDAGTLSIGDTELDLRTKRAIVDGHPVDLSAREFAMAETFFRHPGQVLTREQLLDLVWGYDFDPGSNIVDVYVGYLRRKLGRERITSVRGMGYRFEKPETVAAA
jgi:DNA-binding response OmpR family regulator